MLNAGDCHGAPGDCDVTLSDFAILGQGRNSTGDGIEILNTTHVHVLRVTVNEFNGKCLNIQGSSERNAFEDGSSEGCQSSVNMAGDTNEVLFSHWDATQLGEEDGTNYCYGSANCTNGALNTSSQSAPAGWGVDPKSAVHLDGDRIEWHASSIKGTSVQGGLSSTANTAMIYESYIEGYPFSNQPRTNAAIQIGGKIPTSVLSQALTTITLTVPVTNASVQWLYSQDPARAADVCCHAGRNLFRIYPRDSLPGSTAASAYPAASGPAITRGTTEAVSVNAFSGDGAGHLASRSVTAYAWPAGSVIEWTAPSGGYGVTRLISNHINSIVPLNYADHSGSNPNYFVDSCSDYTFLPVPAQGTTSSVCSDVIAGFVPDGYSILAPSPSFYLGLSWNVEFSNNTFYTGPGGSVDGQGFVKVMANANVSFSPGDDAPPAAPRRFDPAAIASGTYANGAVNVTFGNWNGVFALGALTSPGASVVGWNPAGAFSGKIYDPVTNGILATELLGSGNQCTYTGATAANRGGTSRLCEFPGGVAQDVSTDGNTWIHEWVDRGAGFTTNRALVVNGGTTANGNAGFTGTCASPKSPVVTGGIVTACQ